MRSSINQSKLSKLAQVFTATTAIIFATAVAAAPPPSIIAPIPFGTTSGTVAQGNDSRLVGAVQAAGGDSSATVIVPNCSTAARTVGAQACDIINVKDYGYKIDLLGFGDAAITAGSTAFTSNAANFTAGDVGKVIDVTAAGPSGTTLSTTIAAVIDSHHVTLAAAATAAVATGYWRFGTDGGPALNSALGVMAARNALGVASCVYIPGGWSIVLTNLNQTNGCVVGDGSIVSNLQLAAGYVGDLFYWSDAWFQGSYTAGGSILPKNQFAGPRIGGLSVWGDKNSAAQQNAITFYDRTDFARVFDVGLNFINGRGIYAGLTKNTAQGFIRESIFSHIKTWRVGNGTVPNFEITSSGTGTGNNASDEIYGEDISLIGNEGRGFVIRNNSAALSTLFFFEGLRTEMLFTSPAAVGDGITIGDPVYTGIVSDFHCNNCNVQDIPAGTSAITLTAPSAAAQPYAIFYRGVIGTGAGNGLNIQAGRLSEFDILDNGVSGYKAVIGASPLVSGNSILINANGNENSWNISYDATAVRTVHSPVYLTGVGSSGESFSIKPQDGTVAGGNNRGQYAADVCFRAGNAAQVASGYGAFCAGLNNTVAGQYSGAVGFGNTTAQQGTFITGLFGYDRGRKSVTCLANGASQGATQGCQEILKAVASGTTPAVVTADAAAVSGSNNSNLPSVGGAYAFSAYPVVAFDPTNTKACMWTVSKLLVRKGTANNTTTLVGTPTITQDQCDSTLTAATLTVAADTTYGGITHTVTGVSGVTLNVTAFPRLAETQ